MCMCTKNLIMEDSIMKKILAVVMTLAMILSLSAVLASAVELPEGISFTAGKYGVEDAADFTPVGTLKIQWDADAATKLNLADGDMSDWAAAGYEMVTIDTSNMVSWVGDFSTAPAGWSISTYFVADADYLYIGFYVTDPAFAYGSASAGYNGDAFQVCIDFGGKMSHTLATDPDVLSNPKNIFYSFTCVSDGAPLEIHRQESDNDGLISEANGDGVKGSASKTESGWCAEFALSFQQMYDDYVWKAWEDDPKIYVGGVDSIPLTIGSCLYYLDRSETAGAINWAAGSTNGIVIDDAGTPGVSWTAYDNGVNLELDIEDGVSFTCPNIIILDDGETVPPETEAPDTEAPDTEAPTQAPDTEAPTQAPETEAPTQAPGTQAPVTEAPVEGGCGSVIGFSAIAVLAAAAAAVALKKD